MRTTREKINKYLQRLMHGEDCLEDFIDYSRGYIQYIAFKYLTDKSLVEDVVFLAYDRILRSIQSFDNSKNGLAWIVKITQNEAYKLNQNETIQEISLEECKKTCIEDSFSENDLLSKYDLENAIIQLENQERAIIEYKIFLGMTFREIARELNLPKSTIAYIFKQTLKKLERYLE